MEPGPWDFIRWWFRAGFQRRIECFGAQGSTVDRPCFAVLIRTATRVIAAPTFALPVAQQSAMIVGIMQSFTGNVQCNAARMNDQCDDQQGRRWKLSHVWRRRHRPGVIRLSTIESSHDRSRIAGCHGHRKRIGPARFRVFESSPLENHSVNVDRSVNRLPRFSKSCRIRFDALIGTPFDPLVCSLCRMPSPGPRERYLVSHP